MYCVNKICYRRSTVGSESLIYGSLTLYIQKDSPGADKEANWLPAPAGKFILMMRMYWPDESPPSIIDGTWTPPAAIKAS